MSGPNPSNLPKRVSTSEKSQPEALNPKKWTRESSGGNSVPQLGSKLRALRFERGWSIRDAAQHTGVAAGTWSRIENNKMAPTYPVLIRMMENLGIDWNQLMPVATTSSLSKLPSFSRDSSDAVVQLKTARRVHPHGLKPTGPLRPVIVEISQERPDDFELFGHEGTEFCFVLQGSLSFHSEGNATRTLAAGESVLFDSRNPHAYTSSGCESVKLLIVSCASSQNI